MQPNQCIFCQIINKAIPAYIVFEDSHYLAFLDKRPLFLGHTLLIPKQHIPTFYDLPNEMAGDFANHIKRVGKAVEKAVMAEGSFIATNNIISQSVPHLHTHLVPRKKQDGLRGFFWPRQQYTEEEMLTVQKAIQQQIKA